MNSRVTFFFVLGIVVSLGSGGSGSGAVQSENEVYSDVKSGSVAYASVPGQQVGGGGATPGTKGQSASVAGVTVAANTDQYQGAAVCMPLYGTPAVGQPAVGPAAGVGVAGGSAVALQPGAPGSVAANTGQCQGVAGYMPLYGTPAVGQPEVGPAASVGVTGGSAAAPQTATPGCFPFGFPFFGNCPFPYGNMNNIPTGSFFNNPTVTAAQTGTAVQTGTNPPAAAATTASAPQTLNPYQYPGFFPFCSPFNLGFPFGLCRPGICF